MEKSNNTSILLKDNIIQKREFKQTFISKATPEKRKLNFIFSIIFLRRNKQKSITSTHNLKFFFENKAY